MGNLGGIIALGVFGGFVFLAAIITTIVILIRRKEPRPSSVHGHLGGSGHRHGKYRHLFPGTIIEDDDEGSKRERKKEKDQNYMNIELDDGDERTIHIENIRFLPPDYPLVSCDNDPLASVSRRRRRQSIENFKRTEDSRIAVTQRRSIEDVAVEERIAVAKRARYEMEKTEKTPTKQSPSKISASDPKNGTGRLKFTL